MNRSFGKPTAPCSLCGKQSATPVAHYHGYRIARCRVCGLAYVDPKPSREELAALYAGYHYRNGQDEASWNRLMGRIFRESAELLRPANEGAGPGRLLDVGCGFGTFVGLMRGRGWDATGVDPSTSAAAAAKKTGVPVRLGTLEELDVPAGFYDAITLFYVLEHLPEPIVALKKIHALLKPGGTLLVRVPHTTPIVRLLSPFGAGGSLYDPPFHLYDFSPPVLFRMLSDAGFAQVRTFPGEPTVPSRLGPRIVSLLSGAVASGLYRFSRGTYLLPGVSKTTIARKPA